VEGKNPLKIENHFVAVGRTAWKGQLMRTKGLEVKLLIVVLGFARKSAKRHASSSRGTLMGDGENAILSKKKKKKKKKKPRVIHMGKKFPGYGEIAQLNM